VIRLDRSQLDRYGWTTATNDREVSLFEIAKSLGTPVPPRPDRPITRHLRPLEHAEAETGSLSSILGKAEFPLHTDCAYYRRPPSWIFFRAVCPSTVATLFVDGQSLVNTCDRRIFTALFRVIGLRKHFLCTMVSAKGLRWDTNCMIPADTSARKAAAEFDDRSAAASPTRFEWHDTTTVLILNNRRMLHGRECASHDPKRHLESVLVYPDDGRF